VKIWRDNQRWQTSAREEQRLREEWRLTPSAGIKLVTNNGVVELRNKTTFLDRVMEFLPHFLMKLDRLKWRNVPLDELTVGTLPYSSTVYDS